MNLVQCRESPTMPDDLAGKIALVTSGSRCIGRGTAVALAGAGADVAVNYRTRDSEAGATIIVSRAMKSRLTSRGRANGFGKGWRGRRDRVRYG